MMNMKPRYLNLILACSLLVSAYQDAHCAASFITRLLKSKSASEAKDVLEISTDTSGVSTTGGFATNLTAIKPKMEFGLGNSGGYNVISFHGGLPIAYAEALYMTNWGTSTYPWPSLVDTNFEAALFPGGTAVDRYILTVTNADIRYSGSNGRVGLGFNAGAPGSTGTNLVAQSTAAGARSVLGTSPADSAVYLSDYIPAGTDTTNVDCSTYWALAVAAVSDGGILMLPNQQVYLGPAVVNLPTNKSFTIAGHGRLSSGLRGTLRCYPTFGSTNANNVLTADGYPGAGFVTTASMPLSAGQTVFIQDYTAASGISETGSSPSTWYLRAQANYITNVTATTAFLKYPLTKYFSTTNGCVIRWSPNVNYKFRDFAMAGGIQMYGVFFQCRNMDFTMGAGGDAILIVYCTDYLVDGCNFYGNSNAVGANFGVSVTGGSLGLVRNCRFHNLQLGVSHTYCDSCVVDACYAINCRGLGDTHGYLSRSIMFKDCVAEWCVGNPYHVQSGSGAALGSYPYDYDVSFVNCTVIGMAKESTGVNAVYPFALSGVRPSIIGGAILGGVGANISVSTNAIGSISLAGAMNPVIKGLYMGGYTSSDGHYIIFSNTTNAVIESVTFPPFSGAGIQTTATSSGYHQISNCQKLAGYFFDDANIASGKVLIRNCIIGDGKAIALGIANSGTSLFELGGGNLWNVNEAPASVDSGVTSAGNGTFTSVAPGLYKGSGAGWNRYIVTSGTGATSFDLVYNVKYIQTGQQITIRAGSAATGLVVTCNSVTLATFSDPAVVGENVTLQYTGTTWVPVSGWINGAPITPL